MYKFFLLSSLLYQSIGKVLVYSPDEMRDEFSQKYSNGEIAASLGNFGNPPYGTSLVGPVFYPEAIKERDGCAPLTPIPFSSDPDHSRFPILLLDRGNCAFVVKVRHAEDIGVRLVLIANNIDFDIKSIIMTDNGLGGNLKIPAFLISKEDGWTIKSYIADDLHKGHVSLSVSFDIKKSTDQIKYNFYFSPTSEEARDFLFDFSKTGGLFKKTQAEFIPHYLLWYCKNCQSEDYQIDSKDCLSGGRYCSLDPDGNGDMTGRDVMYEDLRQLCLYKHIKLNEDYSIWFQYHAEYHLQCLNSLFDKTCSEKVMKSIKVAPNVIDKCVNDSFTGTNHGVDDNTLLKAEHDYLVENIMPFYPSLVINEQIYRGDLETDAVFAALCAGFSYETTPDFCRKPEESMKIETKNSKSTVIVIVAILICLALIAAILVVYKTVLKKDLNRDMKVQVNSAVAHYFQLAETR